MQVFTYLEQKYGKILSQFWWILDVICTERLRSRTIINLSKSNFDRICDGGGITSSKDPFDDLSPINTKWMRALSLPKVCLYMY